MEPYSRIFEYGPPGPVPPVPGDDVADPGTEEGKQFQEVARAQDMASTVREVSHSVDKDGNLITKFTMLDGSTQVTTEYVDQGLPSEQVYPEGTITVLPHTDKNGKTVSLTSTIPREDGGKSTEVWYGDGTHVVMSETADGVRTGSCTTPDGRHSVLPDSFFNDPIPTLAGGALSGLETKANQGIPGLSMSELEKVKAGAKWGGPGTGHRDDGLQHGDGGHLARALCCRVVRRRWAGRRPCDICRGGSRTGSRSDRCDGSQHRGWLRLRVCRGNWSANVMCPP